MKPTHKIRYTFSTGKPGNKTVLEALLSKSGTAHCYIASNLLTLSVDELNEDSQFKKDIADRLSKDPKIEQRISTINIIEVINLPKL